MIDATVRGARAMWAAARHFHADHGFSHAAAVAYFSLLSLGPFLFILTTVVAWTLPEGDVAGIVSSRVTAFVPPVAAPLIQRIERDLAAGSGWVALAAPALIWVASTALSALELAVNVAFGTVDRRRFLVSRLKAFGGVSLAVGMATLTMVAREGAVWLDRYRAQAGLPPAFGPRAEWVSLAFLLFLTGTGFVILFKVLPRGAVRWGPCARAAAVTLFLWEACRRLFGAAIAGSPAYGLVTGLLAGLVAFLVWVYAAVVIFLFGAELAAILNGNRPTGGLTVE